MRAYLDNNATTPMAPEVLARFNEVCAMGPLNPGSVHGSGRRARAVFEAAGEEILALVGLPHRRVVFCASATEAANLALRGLAAVRSGPVVHSSVDHPAVVQTAAALSASSGTGEASRSVPVSRGGELDLGLLRAALPGASAASFMAANNETGGIMPVAEIADACRVAGVPLLLDACQGPGKMDFFGTVREAQPDMVIVSGQKMHGPVGIAALIFGPGMQLKQQTTGGGQQHGLRAGTEPVALAAALAAALKLAATATDLAALRAKTDRLWAAVRDAAPAAVATIPDQQRRLANTIHYRIPGLEAQRQVMALDVAGVECSSASACESGASVPSKVLLGMGYSDTEAREGVRMSVSRYTTEAELEFAAATVGAVLRRLLR